MDYRNVNIKSATHSKVILALIGPTTHSKALLALTVLLVGVLCLVPLWGCSEKVDYGQYTAEPSSEYQNTKNTVDSSTEEIVSVSAPEGGQPSLADIPEYEGDPYIEVNNNEPSFTEAEKNAESFESYSDLDYEGRCGTAFALVGEETMPTEKRGNISDVKPTGWHSVRYDFVDGESLYNRCHLLGYKLTGENANEENLITGTRYMNTEGMLPFEDEIDAYVDETDNHVLYRVTPLFYEDELVARGIHMEGYSVEDNGEGVSFNVYCYNVQPGVGIDYETGDNWEDPSTIQYNSSSYWDSQNSQYHSQGNYSQNSASGNSNSYQNGTHDNSEQDYILNTNSKKFHYPWCDSVEDTSTRNKEDYYGTRDELISDGYEPCGACNP
ncbi:MAG: DNA/RNA non-specific endonuclease [Eggerthellaceae bacterium]|nr:DNA/RNA non-specific endonuclease [Eggerthellaceae bacterium]